jgi:adenine-specific DNA-methyltransferase
MPRKSKSSKSNSQQIESVQHHDKRSNIPTEELKDFMSDDDKKPQTILYPRDPSLESGKAKMNRIAKI